MVSIRESRFFALLKNNEISRETFCYTKMNDDRLNNKSILVMKRAYNEEIGLQISKIDNMNEQLFL